MPLDLAVLESRWWPPDFEAGNTSVRGLFDLLADIHEDNPSAYHYEMFNNRASLEEIVHRTARRKRNLYIAAHGGESSISGAEGHWKNRISRTQFRNILRRITTRGGKRRGLFIGSCWFVNEENAKFLLGQHNEEIRIRWIAGYSKSVNWIDSSIVDLYFWNAYFREDSGQRTLQAARSVARKIDRFMPGAYENLGFNIFVRRKGGGVEPLLPVK